MYTRSASGESRIKVVTTRRNVRAQHEILGRIHKKTRNNSSEILPM